MNALDYFNARLEATISPMDYLRTKEANPGKYFLIDVRNGPVHVRSEIIQGAVSIPLQELPDRMHDIPKENEIILYCWDVWCNTAAKAAKLLLENGYNVKELTGGIAAWKQMNFPTSMLTEEQTLPEDCGC
jgi:rhodanese-related sulfurtransferase